MANHEGWYLKANVDISGLLQANKQANSLLATLRKVDAGSSSIHGNDSLARTIKSADIATASYIERLKSEGKTYEANQNQVKLYSSQIDKLQNKQRGLETQLTKIAQASGKNSDAYNVQKTRINQTATAINEFKGQIKSLHSEMATAKTTAYNNSLASSVKYLKSAGKEYDAAKEQAKLYTSQINQLITKERELSSNLAKVEKESGKNSQAYNEQKTKINETATAINELNSKLKAAQVEMAKTKPTAFNKLASGAKQVDSAVGKMKSKLHSAWDNAKAGAGAAAIGIGAVGAAALDGAKKTASLQQTYKEINNLATLGGEKQKEVTSTLMKMQSQGRDMSIKYGKSQQEIAEGYEDLVKRGYTTKQALGALQTELQASVASGDKFSDVTTVSSQVLDAFGMRADDTSKMLKNTKTVVNELAYSADATSTGFGDLGVAMSYVGTAAKANNISLSETASSLGVLSNNGLESDKAGTALRSTINGLTNQINKIGTGKSVFDKLGIKKEEMLDAHGNLKSLSSDMATLYKHIQAHSKGGSDQNGFFKSIFGTTGMNGAEILAKSSKEVEELTKKTEKAGKTGTYVSQLAAKNMGTAQGNIARTKQAMNAFKMTLGNALLPAISEASNSLAKFLLSKDGKQFQKDVGGAVRNVANSLVSFIKWASTHKVEMKAIGGAILAGYSIAKAAKFIGFLGNLKSSIQELKGSAGILRGIGEAAGDLGNNTGGKLLGKGTEKLTGKTGKLTLRDMAKKNGTSVFQAGVTRTGGILKAGAGKMFGGKLLSSGATKLGTKLGGSAGMGMTAVAGAGVALGSGVDIYKAVTTKNPKKKFQNYGKAIGGAIGGGVGLYFGGPAGAAVGSMIGKVVGKWGGDAARKFSKTKFGKAIGRSVNQVTRSVKQSWSRMSKNVSKDWSRTTRSVSRQFGSLGRNWKRDWNSLNRDKNFRNVKNFFKSGFVAIARTSVKEIGIVLRTGSKVVGTVFHTIFRTIRGVTKVVSHTVGLVSDIFHGDWGKAWKDAKGIVSGVIDTINGVMEGFKKTFDAVFGGVIDTVKNVWDFVSGKSWKVSSSHKDETKSVSSANSAVKNMQNGQGAKHHASKTKTPTIASNNYAVTHLRAHASGGAIATAHRALVGEGGPELAYKPSANHARLLGANGPELTRVHAGEHILNARDTAKVMSGGLGRGYALKGYASGTTGLKKTTKRVDNDYKSMSSKSSKELNSFSRKSQKTWKDITSQTKKQTNQTRKNTVADFLKITKQTNKQTDKTRSDTISDYTEMRKGVHSQMDKLHDGVIDLGESTSKGFGKALDKMHDYARSAMSDTIDQINKGISGIDKVLSQFGGNASVIKPVKFATGTDSNGRLIRNTLAMLNDAETGPRQEAVVTEKNEIFMPQGRNTVMPLKRGWGVLNGTQTQQLGLTRFAKGSGISHSQLKKIASKNGADPAKSFADMFTKLLRPGKSDLSHGTTGLAQNSSTHFGVPWNNAMWTVINNAIGGATGKGGTREAFLKYAESTFSGVRYVMGAASKAASDCSGMVMQALRHFGVDIGRSTVDMQNSSGVQYLGKNLSNTIPGDLVIFGHGTGANGHVGIIKNPKTGTMFNETPPRARVTDIASDKSMGYGYYRVKGLHNASSSKKGKGIKPDKRLISLAKRQLGPSALKWIKDKLGDEGSLGGNIGGEGVKRWAGTVKKILGMLHLSTSESMVDRVLRQINTESSGNPHAKQAGADPDGDGSGPAMGLMQTKRSTFEAYKRKGDSGGIFNGPSNIYAGLNYAKHRYGNSLSFLGQGHGYALGGDAKAGEIAMVGEKGPEIVQFKQPTHIYPNDQSKKLRLTDKPKKPKTTKINRGQTPVINININGPISSRGDAIRLGNIIKEKVAEILYDLMGKEHGADLSIY